MDKTLLTPSQQVRFLKEEKGISFNLISEQDAEAFLENKNFLFKLKAFCRNYDTYQLDEGMKGKYVNLDFGELVELSRLDKILRDEILNLTLDIEHYLKVCINQGAMERGVDPYALVRLYIDESRDSAIHQQNEHFSREDAIQDFMKIVEICNQVTDDSPSDEMVERANEIQGIIKGMLNNICPSHVSDSLKGMLNSPYSHDLAEKYQNRTPPYWCLCELLTFGPTIGFYKMCFSKNGPLSGCEREAKKCKSIKNLLRSAQVLRNAAAHNDCLLSTLGKRLKSPSRSGVIKILKQNYSVAEGPLDAEKRVPLAVDLAAVLIAYDVVVPAGQSRNKAREGLERMKERFRRGSACFEDEDGKIRTRSIREFFDYLYDLLDVFIERFAHEPKALH